MDLSIFRNQSGILNVDEYDYMKIAIVGNGSIGSFLALALNKLGFKNLILIDDDKIEKHNVPTQFYFNTDIGKYKVNALNNYLEGNITTFVNKVKPNHKMNADVVFICVDSLKQRKIILNAILTSYEEYNKPKLIIDGRMHRLIFRVFTLSLKNTDLLKNYIEGLLDDEYEGDCTEKGIIQNVFAVVAVMVEQFKKVVNGEPYSDLVNCDFEQYLFIQSAKLGVEK